MESVWPMVSAVVKNPFWDQFAVQADIDVRGRIFDFLHVRFRELLLNQLLEEL